MISARDQSLMMDHFGFHVSLTSLQDLIVHQIAAAQDYAVFESCAHNVGTLVADHTDNAFGMPAKTYQYLSLAACAAPG